MGAGPEGAPEGALPLGPEGTDVGDVCADDGLEEYDGVRCGGPSVEGDTSARRSG